MHRQDLSGFLNLNYRIGRHVQLYYSAEIGNKLNDHGYVDMTENEDTVYFARRDVRTLQNIIGGSYAINNKAGFNLRVRHYWSGAGNKEFFQLQSNGGLANDVDYNVNQDENYNAFNIDLVFKWIFAPGSEFSFAWKNSVYTSGDKVISDYWRNLDNTWKSDQINSFSIKILYYLDYNAIRKNKS
jgi:hypothetical protein